MLNRLLRTVPMVKLLVEFEVLLVEKLAVGERVEGEVLGLGFFIQRLKKGSHGSTSSSLSPARLLQDGRKN